MSKKKIVLGIAVTAVISSILTVIGLAALLGLNGTRAVDMARFIGVKRLIETRYVNAVDSEQLVDGAINGMVQSLGDPHSIYMKPDMFKALKEHTAGAFSGIGVTMGFKDNKVMIVSVLEGTPGEKAGLKANDEILAVDGTPVTEYQPEEVSMHIRGEIGTNVTLTIRREGSEDDRIFDNVPGITAGTKRRFGPSDG